jgi:hypothetical protein
MADFSNKYVLSEDDLAALKALVQEHRERFRSVNVRQRTNRPFADEQEILPPECYLALTPAAGIPGISKEPGTGTLSSEAISSALCQIFQVLDNKITVVYNIGTLQVYNYSQTIVPGGQWILVNRDKFGTWMAVTSGGGTTLILAQLTGSDHSQPGFTQYYWKQVTDSNSPTPLTYSASGLSGGPGNNPAYDIDNIDHPIPLIVTLRKGAGSYWLIDSRPRIEFVRRTTLSPDSHGYFQGFLERWDQASQQWIDQIAILIRDANA